ncbi:MAG: twin-arginine translocase TatA/TatE family subunit [Olsenella sp.]|jgi:sec-independent protein translocase protein TatA|nr:twin-arginine translocase TatA/TatE family subunit [Olsenella sp.]
MILGMGVPELLVILLVVLVIFGPKNLPKLGSAIGKTVKNVREGMEEGDDEPVAEAEKASSSENVEEVVADPGDADIATDAK